MCAFKMSVSKEAVEGLEVVPAGIYMVRFLGFKPKYSKPDPSNPQKQQSLNLNAQMEIIEGDYSGRKLFEGLNDNAGWVREDFCHAFGFPQEKDPTDGSYAIPGEWDGEEGNPETYVYRGPLIGKVAKVEVAVDVYNGKQNNKIRKYFCAIDGCEQLYPQIKHSQDLLAKRK